MLPMLRAVFGSGLVFCGDIVVRGPLTFRLATFRTGLKYKLNGTHWEQVRRGPWNMGGTPWNRHTQCPQKLTQHLSWPLEWNSGGKSLGLESFREQVGQVFKPLPQLRLHLIVNDLCGSSSPTGRHHQQLGALAPAPAPAPHHRYAA